jgi:ABC-type nitrate/sulfonate/bicarbonate transport system substrate-binding protein
MKYDFWRHAMVNIFAALIGLMFVHIGSVDAADKVRVGVPQQVIHWATFPLAQKKGFFKEEGLDAEIIRILGPAGRSALVTGEIDYYTTVAFMTQSIISGMPARVMASFVTCPAFVLMSRPEWEIAQDLKGQTVGIGGPPGSAVDIIARLSLRHLGLNPEKDMKFVFLNSHERNFLALQQNLFAAALLPPPFDYQGSKLGFHSLARAHDFINYPEGGVIAHTRKIKEKPDEIKRVIRAGIKANRYIRAEREGTIQFLMEWQKVNRETATANYNGANKIFPEDGAFSEAGLRLIIEEAKKSAKVEREVALGEVADLSILKEAQRELGTKAK